MIASWASSEHARRTMAANRGRDTKPELRIRSALHRRGMRFRV
ncbi:very short patch repair endonuclease, partial [Mycobacterium tuberculosis]|nr:very short patch repair endonuclease [Mycobacterium tuberculosis]